MFRSRTTLISTPNHAEKLDILDISANQRTHQRQSASIKMKKDIHPQYYPAAKVSCACGAKLTVGSTKPEIKVEICSACHPFYTGKGKLIDTAGRVEKFRARREKARAVSSVKRQVSRKK